MGSGVIKKGADTVLIGCPKGIPPVFFGPAKRTLQYPQLLPGSKRPGYFVLVLSEGFEGVNRQEMVLVLSKKFCQVLTITGVGREYLSWLLESPAANREVRKDLLFLRDRLFRGSLRRSLVCWLVVVQALSLMIALGVVFLFARKAILAAEKQELETDLAEKEAVVSRWLERERMNLVALARELEDTDGIYELRRRLAEEVGGTGFDNLAFCNSRGQANVLLKPVNGVSATSICSAVLTSKNSVVALRSGGTAKYLIVIGVPVRGRAYPAGTLLGFLSFERLRDLVYVSEGTMLRLVDSDGAVLFSTGGFSASTELTGVPPGRYTVTVKRPLWGTSWELVAVRDAGPLVAALAGHLAWVAVGVVPGFGLVALLALRLVAPLEQFLQEMVEAAFRVAAGLESRRIAAEGKGVFALLARAFNGLVDSLEGTRRELGEKVAMLQWQKEALERHARQLEDLQSELYRKQVELMEKTRILEHMLATDQLTGLLTRGSFTELARLEIRKACLNGEPLVFGVLDFDGFKEVNDTYGHAAGDAVLARVAKVIKGSLRDNDLVGRYGGDEFVLLLPNTEPEAGLLVAERIRERVGSTVIKLGSVGARVTVSIGLAFWKTDGSPPGTEVVDADAVLAKLFETADEALYVAKSGGRNRVVSGSLA